MRNSKRKARVFPKVIATRKTYGGEKVKFWDDGTVTTGSFDQYVKGFGPGRTTASRAKFRSANWLLAGEISLYDKAELPCAIAAARSVVGKRDALIAFRRRVAACVRRIDR